MLASIKKTISVLSALFLYLFFSLVQAQPLQRVTHLSGTQRINNMDVRVTSAGQLATLRGGTHCSGDTGPYYMGYNTADYSCRTGSYTFSFTPPVAYAIVNFSGLSTSSEYDEQVMVFVNGHHYSLPAPGSQNSCEEMAVLTEAGDITGCSGCSVSGWNNTRIEGPIYTLTIVDSVLKGEPAGALFGLWISWISLEEDLDSRIKYYKRESAAGSALIIETDQTDIKLLSIAGPTGEKMLFHSYSDFPVISVDITHFTRETDYVFELLVNDQLIFKKITIM